VKAAGTKAAGASEIVMALMARAPLMATIRDGNHIYDNISVITPAVHHIYELLLITVVLLVI
jgi:hypothetical protein